MGVQLTKTDRRRSRRPRRRSVPMSDINVTPFVDVMLVLLVVFMVAAPLMTTGIPVDLPRTQAGTMPADIEEPLTVTLTADGQLMVQTTEVAQADFLTRLRGIAEERSDDRVFLRADGAIPYDQVMQLMGVMTQAGFSNIGLVTELGTPVDASDGG